MSAKQEFRRRCFLLGITNKDLVARLWEAEQAAEKALRETEKAKRAEQRKAPTRTPAPQGEKPKRVKRKSVWKPEP